MGAKIGSELLHTLTLAYPERYLKGARAVRVNLMPVGREATA